MRTTTDDGVQAIKYTKHGSDFNINSGVKNSNSNAFNVNSELLNEKFYKKTPGSTNLKK